LTGKGAVFCFIPDRHIWQLCHQSYSLRQVPQLQVLRQRLDREAARDVPDPNGDSGWPSAYL
jgi:hypothetical protein